VKFSRTGECWRIQISACWSAATHHPLRNKVFKLVNAGHCLKSFLIMNWIGYTRNTKLGFNILSTSNKHTKTRFTSISNGTCLYNCQILWISKLRKNIITSAILREVMKKKLSLLCAGPWYFKIYIENS
jgi:hypothetical protein